MACAVVAFSYLSQRASGINKESHLFARRLSSQAQSGAGCPQLSSPEGSVSRGHVLLGQRTRSLLDTRGVSL